MVGVRAEEMVRRAAKIDDNQTGIVSALRKVGCRVLSLAAVGRGCPDLLVYRAGRLYLLEIKDGAKSPSRRKLTSDQVEFHKAWPVTVVTTIEEAYVAVGIRRIA
jgi:Holliday junction resolvase